MILPKLIKQHDEAFPERLLRRLAKLVQLGARDVVKEFPAIACQFSRVAETEPEFHFWRSGFGEPPGVLWCRS